MNKKSIRVFLSHATRDGDIAQKVGHHLSQAGYDVWDPAEQILPGADWAGELKQALDAAEAIVVFISPEAMASREISREIEYALSAKRLRGRLIPVIIRPTKDAPWILDALEPVPYQGPGRTSRHIIELLSQPHNASEAQSRAV